MFQSFVRKFNPRSTSTIFVILVLFGNFISPVGQGLRNGSGVQEPASALTNTPRPGQVTTKMWVYFTQPENKLLRKTQFNDSMEKYLIDEINRAAQSIYIASYDGALPPVMDALIARKKAKPNIDIRWVTDDSHCGDKSCTPDFKLLKGAGIQVRWDKATKTRKDTTSIMHDKFLIFDGKIVWTGSTNLTDSGVFVQHNNTVMIESPALAKIYKAEFDEMWDGKFGTDSPPLAAQNVNLSDTEKTAISVFFTPDSSDKSGTATQKSIVPVVNSATTSIYFMAYSFTDGDLAEAIIQRAQNKVKVQGIFDRKQKGTDGDFSEINKLACAKNVALRVDWTIMHSKVIVVDRRYVVTGSLNFSTRANEVNDENVIIIDSPALATLYIKEFERVWQAKSPYGSSVVTKDYACSKN